MVVTETGAKSPAAKPTDGEGMTPPQKQRCVFVILRNGGRINSGDNYSVHGCVGGVEDAIGYGELEDARKFLTREDAQSYIDSELPEWGRSLHHPEPVFPWDLLFTKTPLAAYLRYHDLEIPPALLEPAKGRLLVWRR